MASAWPQEITHTYTDPETGKRYTYREDISDLPGGIDRVAALETATAALEGARHEVDSLLVPLRTWLSGEQFDQLDCAITYHAAAGDLFVSHVVGALQAARGRSTGIWLVAAASSEAG